MNYLVADFITRMKNASLARKKQVVLPYSKTNKAIADVLVKEGFLKTVKINEKERKKSLTAEITYVSRVPRMIDTVLVSKPSLRIYVASKNIARFEKKGMHTAIISTNHGIMSGKQAQKKGLGGEILFSIW